MQTVAQTTVNVAQNQFIEMIGAVKMPRFVAINGYKNQKGDVSNYLIAINNKYGRKVTKDIGYLKALIKSLAKTPETALEYMAAAELLQSFTNNLSKETASAQSLAQTEAYETINGSIKRHTGTGVYYLKGFCRSKVVLVKGVHKEVKSRALTIAKDKIRKDLKTSAYVMFPLNFQNFEVKMEGNTLLLTQK